MLNPQCLLCLVLITFACFIQTCHIDMGVRKNSNSTVHLAPLYLLMKQKPDMNMFKITHSELYHNGENKLRVQLVMKRKVTSELMTTYFPSILLLAITFATTFFKPFFFEAALSVNLTTMLVMTTIFISKMESLPPTSDIKMIDCWLVICQMVPFAEVVLLTAMEYQRTDDRENDERSRCVQVDGGGVENGIEEDDNKRWYRKFEFTCPTPSLRVLGKI